MDDRCLRILIAEDEPAHAAAIDRAFKACGIEVEVSIVGTLRDFLTTAASTRPDIALMDLNLPDGSAVEALAYPPEAGQFPVLLMTSYGNEEVAVGAMRSGAFDYVVKSPESFAAMPRTVQRAMREWTLLLERQAALDELRNSEERYRNIFDNITEGIFQVTHTGRYLIANPAISRMCGYASPEEMIRSVTDIAQQMYVHPEERRRFIGTLELEGQVKGFEVEMKRKDGSTFWVSMNARAVRGPAGEIGYYEGTCEDITERRKAEDKLKETLDRLRKAVGTTIQVMVSAVEAKDPYTAGHQRRVADLARAIATEMGLPHDAVEGIRMAAAIHDIGKISVPAEILSKPTRLTSLEMDLIKTHSQSGYDILKDVESPWPLAATVLQHHERMNGSGYPQALSGSEILPGARVIAVADVVESMASHRPYRPALGIEAALEEIEKNRGTLYDDDTAGQCLKLFRDKGFSLD